MQLWDRPTQSGWPNRHYIHGSFSQWQFRAFYSLALFFDHSNDVMIIPNSQRLWAMANSPRHESEAATSLVDAAKIGEATPPPPSQFLHYLELPPLIHAWGVGRPMACKGTAWEGDRSPSKHMGIEPLLENLFFKWCSWHKEKGGGRSGGPGQARSLKNTSKCVGRTFTWWCVFKQCLCQGSNMNRINHIYNCYNIRMNCSSPGSLFFPTHSLQMA